MDIAQSELQGIKVVSVRGRLDAVTSPELDMVLEGVNEGHLVLDLADLEYISSAGLRILLASAKRLRSAKGDLHVASLQDSVSHIFEISGFDSIFIIHDSQDAAVKAIG